MIKHVNLLPSVMIYTGLFCTDWPAGEWIRQETIIIEKITYLKTIMNERDVKIILLLYKYGNNTIDKDVIDERLNAIKKHCQLENKSFLIITNNDLSSSTSSSSSSSKKNNNDLLKRLSRIIRDYSTNYYINYGKKLRAMERVTRSTEFLLLTRINFKVAFFYEFQSQISRSLRNYKQSYSSLIELLKVSSNDKPEMINQIKAMAEILSFKICSIELKNGAVKEASQHFRNHMKIFATTLSHFPWMDHNWSANQYLIYVSLLTHYNINTSHTDADRSYYYHRAALYTLKRYDDFKSKRRTDSAEELGSLINKFGDLKTIEPQYFGSSLRYDVADIPAESRPSPTDLWKITRNTQLLKEEEVNHVDEILALLQKSLKNINPLHKRRKAHLRVLIAKQLMSIGDYDMASAHLSSSVDYLHREQWSFCAIPVLRKKMQCAIYLGRPREYIPAAMKLYKIAVLNDFLDKEDCMTLHRDIMSVIQNSEKPTREYLQNVRCVKDGVVDSSGDNGVYVNLPLRPEFGAAAIDSHPPEYFLPDSYTIDFSEISNGLFEIDVRYVHDTVEVGHHVRTSIYVTSRFQDVLKFAEIIAYFTEENVSVKFIHNDACNTDESRQESVFEVKSQDSSLSTSNTAEACLEFYPNIKKELSIDLFIPENAVHKHESNHICLEKLLMTMSVPLPTQTSGEDCTDDEVQESDDVGQKELDILKLDEALQAVIREEIMDDMPSLPQSSTSDIPDSTLPLQSSLTIKLEESTVDTDDVNIEMEEESLDVAQEDQLKSEETQEIIMQRTDTCSQEEHDDTDSDQIAEEEDEQDEEAVVDEEEEDEEEDQNGDSDDNYISESKEEYIPSLTATQENVNEDYELDSDDEVDSNRLSTSRLGVVVSDLNKLDPVMPVVVDKEIQKSRSRSSSLTPSYAAEVLGSLNLPSTKDNSNIRQSDGDMSKLMKSGLFDLSPTATDQSHPRTQSLPPKLVHKTTEAMRKRGHREIFFVAPALSKAFRDARLSNFGVPGRVKETADFLDMQNAPKLLAISPPISYLQMLSPAPSDDEPICILQGTIQRLNFVFSSGKHTMLQGKVFLKSDYGQLRSSVHNYDDCHFFWYPTKSSWEETALDGPLSESKLDSILFHPFTNNAETNQPLYPLLIENQEVDSIFACPVFIKSDVQGDINLTIRIEYIPSIFLKNTIFKEFTVRIRVLKPFGMNFNISSLNDPHCGAEKKAGTSTVLRGDVINMAASLDCVNSLDSDVEVLVMNIATKNATFCVDERSGESIEIPVFKLANNYCIESNATSNSDTQRDLLSYGVAYLPALSSCNDSETAGNHTVKSYISQRQGEKKTIILRSGEAYVGSANLKCLNLESLESNLGAKVVGMLSQANSSVSASMGDIIVNWRINDPFFFRAVDLTHYRTAVDDGCEVKHCEEVKIPWLLPIGSEAASSTADAPSTLPPLNNRVTHTRVCNMLFSVPKVHVINAPFYVRIDTPNVVSFGEPFTVHLNIFNKLNTLERVVMVVELSGEFLMTGGTFQVIEIAPKDDIDIEFKLVPLIAGQVPLPRICITSERTKATVLEFGTYSIPKHVFVKPIPVSN